MSITPPIPKAQRHPAQADFFRNVAGRHVTVLLLAVLTLWIDFTTGPTILFPIWFGLPIMITAWFDGFWVASIYALVLPMGRIVMKNYWPPLPIPMSHWWVNFVIRITALETMAFLTARMSQLTKQVRVLQGLLPICMYCHKMRTETGEWERLEVFLEEHSEAEFTHGICPTCLPTRKPNDRDR